MSFARALFATLLLLLPLSASALTYVGGAVPGAIPTIASVAPANASFAQGTSAGTLITPLTTLMSPPSATFSGTYALSTSLGVNFPCTPTLGANNSLVQISGANLQVSSAGAAQGQGTYAVCLVAQQTGIANSPFALAMTLTINAAGQTIASTAVSNNSFTAGSASATIVGGLTTAMSPTTPLFMGSYTGLAGTDAASFQLGGTNLETNGVLCTSSPPCTYSVNPIASQTGISNSPFSGTALTITANAPVFTALGLSGTTFLASTPSAVVGSLSTTLASGAPNPAYSIVSTGTDHSSTACTSTNGTNFQLVGATLETNGTGLTAGSYPGVCVKATQAGVSYIQAFTLTGSTSGPVVGSLTVKNTAGSSTPTNATQTCITSGNTCFAFRAGQGFKLAAVPAGSIAVPNIGGSPVRYQADLCAFWPDGSLKHCSFKFFLPQLTAGSTEQISFTTQTGSYDHTSSGTVADITGGSDYKVEVSNESQIGISYNSFVMPFFWNIGMHVSGGSVSSVFFNNQTNVAPFGNDCTQSTGGCNPVHPGPIYGCTVAPVITVNFDGTTKLPNSAVVTSAGSGCTVDGSGSYVCGFNKLETNSPATVTQIEKGQLVDTWEAWGPCYDNTGGAAHTRLYVRVIVQHWKDVAQATYAFNAVGMPTSALYIPGGTMPSLMYDACWQNGSTLIRGACGGSGETALATWQGINHTIQGGWLTLDEQGKEDWSANDTALKAVHIADTSADEVFLKGTGLIPPYDDTAATGAASNFGATIAFTGKQNQSTDQCQYYPMGSGCTDSDPDWGNAGSHRFTAMGSTGDAMCYLMMPFASDQGNSWCTQSRIAMASIHHVIGGALEPATGLPVNIVSTSTYPSLTPLRANAVSYIGIDMTAPAGVATVQAADGFVNNKIDWGHVADSELILPFVLEARPWMYYVIDGAASVAILEGTTSARNVTFSGTFNQTFNGLTFDSSQDGLRQITWATLPVSTAAMFLPTSFPEQAYYEFLMQQNFTFAIDEVQHVGTITDGNGTVTKANSLASVGVFNTLADFQNLDAPLAQFMQGYFSQYLSLQVKWWAHKYPDLDTLWGYQTGTALLGQTSQSCAYNAINYVYQFWNSLFQYSPAAGWNSTDATNPQVPNFDKRGASNNIITTSGSSVITGNAQAVDIDYPLNSGIPMPALSRIIPTIVNPDSECIELNPDFSPNSDCGASPTGTWPPPATINGTSNGTFQTTWYYYYPLDVTHGVVSTDNSGITGTMSISGTALTGPSGLAPGMFIGGVGVTGGTKILSGTSSPYTVNNSQTVGSETMVADPNMLVFTGTTLSTWGWVPSTCGTNTAGFATANWESFPGQVGSDGRWAEMRGSAAFANSVNGPLTKATTTITNFDAHGQSGYPATIDPQYLYGQNGYGPGN